MENYVCGNNSDYINKRVKELKGDYYDAEHFSKGRFEEVSIDFSKYLNKTIAN